MIKLLYRNWKSFYRSIKCYNPETFTGRPKMPKYKHKVKGRNITVFTNQTCKLKGGYIHFSKKANLQPLKTKVSDIQQVRIIPQATCYVVEVIYKKEVKNVELQPDTYLSIDTGLNNLATCVNNIGRQPFIVNGRPLKSINQYFNKKKSQYMSYVGDRGKSNKIDKLTFKRNNKVEDYIHKTSRFIVNYCIEHKISTIVIGKNDNWKQNINIGKRNNQNFVQIPFARLIEKIEYKAEEVGIKVITKEESYTSKCSFLDLEPVMKQDHYLGKRIKRGLFRSFSGIEINADVNGAYNILRKEIPNLFEDGIEGLGLIPLKVNLS